MCRSVTNSSDGRRENVFADLSLPLRIRFGMEIKMISFVKMAEVIANEGKKTGYTLLDERHGCVNGSKCGVSLYTMEEYGKVGCHDDQEGFFVLEGHGKAMIGDEEIDLEPGVTFMVPAHVGHSMKKDKDCDVCKVFWFHAAV